MSSRLFQLLNRFVWRIPSVRKLSEAHDRLVQQREALTRQRDLLESERDELSEHARRLSGEIAGHQQREQAWGKERSDLLRQRDALERERSELARHLERTREDLYTALGHEQSLARKMETLTTQRDALEAERDEIKEHLEKLRSEQEKLSRLLGAPAGHFYSPVVDPDDPHVRRVCAAMEKGTGTALENIRCDEDAMLEWFHRLAGHYGQFPFPDRKAPDFRYYFENPAFSGADAVTLFGMVRELCPERVIEVGAGFSSCLLMDTNDRYLGGKAGLTFIDPHPETLEALLETGDPYRGNIRRQALQDVPTSLFTALESNDILFLDSSHVAKTASDVNDYLFRLLPALRPGVVVHVHDIFYPFEYPPSWVLQEKRSWNEAYALRAFLEYNHAFEVIFFNNYVFRKHRRLTAEHMPRCLASEGGSIWLRKIR